MNKDSKIYIAGHRGLVGSAIQRILSCHGYSNLICENTSRTGPLNAEAVEKFFSKENPEYVFLAAAGSVVFTPTTLIQLISYMKTYRFRITFCRMLGEFG